MPRFEVLAGTTLIGHSDLEFGDAAMGSVGGTLSPSPAYFTVQPDVVAERKGAQAHLSLVVRPIDGQAILAQGGVQILDYSAELGSKGIEVHVHGISYPQYEELFPEHVAAYRAQFAKE